jgi:hypothetical protein
MKTLKIVTLALCLHCVAFAQSSINVSVITYSIAESRYYTTRSNIASAVQDLYSRSDGGQVIGTCNGTSSGEYDLVLPRTSDFGKFMLFYPGPSLQNPKGAALYAPVDNTIMVSPVTVCKKDGRICATWSATSYGDKYATALVLVAKDALGNIVLEKTIPMQQAQEIYEFSDLPSATAEVSASLAFPDLAITKQVPVHLHLSSNIVVPQWTPNGQLALHNYGTELQQVNIVNASGALVETMQVAPGVHAVAAHLAAGTYALQCAANKTIERFAVKQ